MTFVVSILLLYRGPDSNRHVLIRQQILSLSCLPISPPRRNRWVEGRTRTDTIMFCRHSPYSIRAPRHLSEIWESNPHHNIGSVVCYLYTNFAQLTHILCLIFKICDLRIANRRLHEHKDSNPDLRFWRPTFYHWTMDVCHWHLTRYKESNLE